MGVDLKLLPFDHDAGDWAYSNTILQLSRRSELWDTISELATMPVPERFQTYTARDYNSGGHCYGDTQKDSYGGQVRWCFAEDLVALKDHEAIQDDDRNQAIWAYLEKLRPRTKVALYWH